MEAFTRNMSQGKGVTDPLLCGASESSCLDWEDLIGLKAQNQRPGSDTHRSISMRVIVCGPMAWLDTVYSIYYYVCGYFFFEKPNNKQKYKNTNVCPYPICWKVLPSSFFSTGIRYSTMMFLPNAVHYVECFYRSPDCVPHRRTSLKYS